MSRNLVCVDLFSGLGGFSESMFQRGWKVTRIDNDEQFKEVPCTTIADIMTLNPEDLPQNPDILLMSPPCQCFSVAALSHYWENGRPKNDKTRFAIKLVKRALWIKDAINPKYWILENPMGMLRKVLGRPPYHTAWAAWYSEKDPHINPEFPPKKPTDLWGLLPNIDWPTARVWEKASRGAKLGVQGIKATWNKDTFRSKMFAYLMPRSPALRSLIPYNFSEALAIAIEQDTGGQTTLLEHVF